MRIAVCHNAVEGDSSPDEADVLVQAAAVSEALEKLGHGPVSLPCGLNLERLERDLKEIGPDLVFNLVESLGGRGAMIHAVPFLLEALSLPFTGCRASAMMLTSNKMMAKARMAAANLPTPEWVGPFPPMPSPLEILKRSSERSAGTWIIKSVWEHASIGLDREGLLVDPEPAELAQGMARRAPGLGGSCFAEEFIDGREFNLSVLARPDGIPEVLPPAEIRFVGYGPDMPRIVGYSAKWIEDSYEYHHTPRRFDFGDEDGALLEALKGYAIRAWTVFGLNGYARVDFRVDGSGKPFILEINANPCLSPDAGYAAALERAGIPFEMALSRILGDSLPSPAFQKEPLR